MRLNQKNEDVVCIIDELTKRTIALEERLSEAEDKIDNILEQMEDGEDDEDDEDEKYDCSCGNKPKYTITVIG